MEVVTKFMVTKSRFHCTKSYGTRLGFQRMGPWLGFPLVMSGLILDTNIRSILNAQSIMPLLIRMTA